MSNEQSYMNQINLYIAYQELKDEYSDYKKNSDLMVKFFVSHTMHPTKYSNSIVAHTEEQHAKRYEQIKVTALDLKQRGLKSKFIELLLESKERP